MSSWRAHSSSRSCGYPPRRYVTNRTGEPVHVRFTLCLVELLVMELIPRTSVLGAIYLVGYLAGAIATHVRVGSPLATHVLFPVYVAAFVWGGLALRNPRILALLKGDR